MRLSGLYYKRAGSHSQSLLSQGCAGLFFIDEAKIQKARTINLLNCQKLRDILLKGYL